MVISELDRRVHAEAMHQGALQRIKAKEKQRFVFVDIGPVWEIHNCNEPRQQQQQLHSFTHQWFVNKFAIFISTVIVQSEAHVSCRPRLSCVRVADAAHVPGFVVLLAFLTNCKSAVWKLNVQGLLETWRREGEHVAVRELLWVQHLLLVHL